MKLYHYVVRPNTVSTDGILCAMKAPRDLKRYADRAGSEDREEIRKWLESTFEGRSRSISVLTEKVQTEGNDPKLKHWENLDLFSFELDELLKDGIVEAVWCKDGSDNHGQNEKFFKVKPEEIDCSPLPWHKVCYEKGLLFAVIRHYLLVLKDGKIPPKYLTKEQ